MKIERVYIGTYKHDFWFARICISSIRYWYPQLKITLIKDLAMGSFDTSDAENFFEVEVLDTPLRSYGWGFSKFEALFSDQNESFLFLDADTMMIGPVLEGLESFDKDFLIDDEIQAMDKIRSLYFDLDRLSELDPDFVYPGRNFNSGQWFGTSGLLQRKDLDSFVDWKERPVVRRPDVFKQADQGLLNYIIFKKALEGRLTYGVRKLMIWPSEGQSDFIDPAVVIDKKRDYPYIVHFAGIKHSRLSQYPHRELLAFFERLYYLRVGGVARMKHHSFHAWHMFILNTRSVLSKLLK